VASECCCGCCCNLSAPCSGIIASCCQLPDCSTQMQQNVRHQRNFRTSNKGCQVAILSGHICTLHRV
jgi:hypothetical protein